MCVLQLGVIFVNDDNDLEQTNNTTNDVINRHKFVNSHIHSSARSQGITSEKMGRVPNEPQNNRESYFDVDDSKVSGNMKSDIEAPLLAEGIMTTGSFFTNKWLWIIIIGAGLFFFILMISVAFLLKNSDNLNYASGNLYANEEYEKLYSAVEEVVSDYQQKYSVKVNKYLIIAALTAFEDNENYFDNAANSYDNINVDEEVTDSSGTTSIAKKSLSAMKAKIEILAKYQIKTVTTCNFDSTDPRKIASNDDNNNVFNFWTSAASKEKNYDCSGSGDTYYALSLEEGNIDDDESGSVFYWNLIDEDFFKEYYSEYFANITDPEVYNTQVARAVEYIYLYAKTLENLDCNNGGLSNNFLATNLTPTSASCNLVSVGPDKNGRYAGSYQLEEYVAGVIAHEAEYNYVSKYLPGGFTSHKDQVKEAMKAFAIAIRTFTLNRSNGCTKTLQNSTNDQTFEPTNDAFIWEVVNETAGVVMTKNGTIFPAEYDSFYTRDGVNCSNGRCTVTYKKQPTLTSTHQVSVPESWTSAISGSHGHGRGMSQWAMVDLAANQNMDFQEILSTFYDSDYVLQRLTGSGSTSSSTTAFCQRTGPSSANSNGTCDGTTIYRSKKIGDDSLKSPMNLLACTADQAEQAFAEIAEACGKIPHDGSMRSLNATVSAARSSTSFHYTGRAFDLSTEEGMQSGDTYFYVTFDDTSGNDNSHYYRLYCKINGSTNSTHAAQRTITPLVYSRKDGKPITKKTVTDNFLDVTGVLNDYGLYGIGPRSCMSSGNYMCTEWWHFQDTSGLVVGKTTFEEALNQYYGLGYSYSGTPVGNHLKKIWNGGVFG